MTLPPSVRELQRREIVRDGELDLFALNDVLNDLVHGVNNLRVDSIEIKEQVTKTNGRVTALEKFKQVWDNADSFAQGVVSGRSKVLGILDRSIVLGIGLGGLLIALVPQIERLTR